VSSNHAVRLLFVEKKIPFNIEAQHLLHEMRTNLNIKTINNVRILIKYLVKDVDDKTFASSLNTIFSEPPVDNLYLKKFPKKPQTNAFGVAFLPGQFDQRADSTEQCLRLINPKLQPKVNTAIVYILEGKISINDLQRIKKYLINAVDSHEINIYANELVEPKTKTAPIAIIKNFRKWNNNQLNKFHSEHSLAMTLEDLVLIQKYFNSERRDPTITEIKVIDTY
jgi:phosphoribosylformylglycinamidine synthase